jgi:hypothetical protein
MFAWKSTKEKKDRSDSAIKYDEKIMTEVFYSVNKKIEEIYNWFGNQI